MIGEKFGSYQVISKIGEGGMGAVYLAVHPLIERKVAVKVLLAELSSRPDSLARFFTEAKASARLRHPALVDTIDYGTHPSGSAYIIMEYLEGESLGTHLRRVTSLPHAVAVRIARNVAEGVGAAHRAGIVHRDLKPDNVFLTPDPRGGDDLVKILDFGIAKLADAEAGPGTTKTGLMIGTPLFMSPEQCRGAGQVDERADIYSLGCMLFCMLCGRPPFAYAGAGELIGAHLHEQPPTPRSIDPSIPEALEAVVAKALAKPQADRYQSMAEFADALDLAIGVLPAARSGATAVMPVASMLGSATPSPGASRASASGLRTPSAVHSGTATGTSIVEAIQTASTTGTRILQAAVPEPRSLSEPRTTLSGAAGARDRDPAGRPRNRMLLVGGVAAAAAVAITMGALSMGKGPPAPPVTTAAMPSPPAPGATPAQVSEPPKPAAPAPAVPVTALPSAAVAGSPPKPRQEEQPRTTVAAARPRSVRITVSNPPEGMVVYVDGRWVKTQVRLPLDGKPHTLRFESARTRPETKVITADQDQVLELANKPRILVE